MAPEMQGLLARFSVCAWSQLPLEEKLAPASVEGALFSLVRVIMRLLSLRDSQGRWLLVYPVSEERNTPWPQCLGGARSSSKSKKNAHTLHERLVPTLGLLEPSLWISWRRVCTDHGLPHCRDASAHFRLCPRPTLADLTNRALTGLSAETRCRAVSPCAAVLGAWRQAVSSFSIEKWP